MSAEDWEKKGSETLSDRDVAVEPPGMGSRRVSDPFFSQADSARTISTKKQP
jgi:hypothetical protein|tara:strand:- start:13585 stop:13740 length:156 start_codon:yes stop_codon:yes gene_type:complete